MSRSFAGTSLTRLPSIDKSPELIDSSPAIMRSVVDFPQPDGPEQHHELAVFDIKIDGVDREQI